MTTETLARKEDTTGKDYLAFDKLKDGRTVEVRAICPEDKSLLEEGMHHLSKQSLYFRFFIFKNDLSSKELDYFTNLDFVSHVALLAGLFENGRFSPAGTARYIVSSDQATPDSAEFAVTVAEEYQSMGFGTVLMRHLAKIARENGLKELTGLVLPENNKMLGLLNKCGLPYTRSIDKAGEWEVRLKLQA
jgi:GNAT superfamily N-acetyltransferase